MNILNLLSGIPAAAATYFTRKMELKAEERQQQQAIKKALVERQLSLIEQGLHADMNWEMEFARQAASSWKDEYTLIVISIPAILCFIPGGAVYVADGFAALKGTPQWYQWTFLSLFLATFGIRLWRRQQSDT